MRKTIIALATALIVTVPVSAEIQTYTDDYVSFQYDDEAEGFISRYCFSNGFIHYRFFENDMGVSEILVARDPADLEKYENAKGIVIKKISDNVLVYRTENEDKFYDLILESLFIQDNLDIPDELDTVEFYKNYPYSEQALNYAQAGWDICNEYLTFKITGKDAEKRMEELIKRAKDYSETTEDIGDQDVYSTVNFTSLSFALNDDSDVIKLKEELELILANK